MSIIDQIIADSRAVTANFDKLWGARRSRIARAWGLNHGFHGASGGWIYKVGGGTVCQGWGTFSNKYAVEIARDLPLMISRALEKCELVLDY